MTLRKIRHMGKETRYSAISVLSLMAALLLHLLHWLSASMLIGMTAGLHSGHHDHMTGNGSVLMNLLMLALFIINLISMYYAGRQLTLAWKNRESRTHHTYFCSVVSIFVLCMGLYTVVSI